MKLNRPTAYEAMRQQKEINLSDPAVQKRLAAQWGYVPAGAQSAPSIRPAALSPVINWLRNGCDPMKAADELEMLAAAPEAKP